MLDVCTSSVGLELCFARTPDSDTAAELLQVGPHAHQAWQHVLKLRQLHLHLRLARPRARREDVEYQLGAIHHALAGRVLDVLALRRRQLVVEHDQRRVLVVDDQAQLLDLSLPQVGRRIRLVDLLGNFADYEAARGIHEALQLLEMLVHLVLRVRPFARGPDEYRSLDRGLQLNDFFGDTATSSSALHRMRRSDRYRCKVP